MTRMEGILEILLSQTENAHAQSQENVVYQAFLFGVSNWLFECGDHKALMPTTIEELITSCDAFFLQYLIPSLKTRLTVLFEVITQAQPALVPSEFLSETYPLIYDPEYDIFQELEQSETLSEEFKKTLSEKLASQKQNQKVVTPPTPSANLIQKRNLYKKTRRLTGLRGITPLKRNGRRAKTLKHHE